MTVPQYGGCLWPMDSACFTDAWEALDPDVRQRALALASSTLARLTGNRVGNCPITVRPCGSVRGHRPLLRDDFDMGGFYAAWVPLNWGGKWSNCGCAGPCDILHQIELPAPIGRVDQVKADGVVLAPTDYRVDNGKYLVNLSGTEWPTVQNLQIPDTEPGTFSVTYLNAYPVDSLGAYAVGVLALEYAEACVGNKCRLPAGVTTIARQGITMEVNPGMFPDGFTGLREVDTYIGLWNPAGLRRQATVWTPDMHRPRTTTLGEQT